MKEWQTVTIHKCDCCKKEVAKTFADHRTHMTAMAYGLDVSTCRDERGEHTSRKVVEDVEDTEFILCKTCLSMLMNTTELKAKDDPGDDDGIPF